jgi:iron complex transport system ATP-binding protein
MSPRLSLSPAMVSLGQTQVLDLPELSFEKGQLVALLGPNGAGKTTLLKAVAGLLPHQIMITSDGKSLAGLSPAARARHLGYLPQGHLACWPLPAREIVALGRLPHELSDPRRPSAADNTRIDQAMERTGTLAFSDRPVTELSGGERARVMLARVLAGEPAIILADEPTAALDPRHQYGVMQELKAEAARGALVLAATHDLALADRMADRVLLLQSGRLVADGPPQLVLTPERLAAVYGIAARRHADGTLAIDGVSRDADLSV